VVQKDLRDLNGDHQCKTQFISPFSILNIELVLTVAEFMTKSHNSISISQKLLFIKKSIEVHSIQQDYKPKIIVVDFSWALINSTLEIFCEVNNSISQYILYCYENLVVRPNPNFSNQMIQIYICASHLFIQRRGQFELH
jgi:hypothetical protein